MCKLGLHGRMANVMDVDFILDLGKIIDLRCGLMHPHRSLSLRLLSFLY